MLSPSSPRCCPPIGTRNQTPLSEVLIINPSTPMYPVVHVTASRGWDDQGGSRKYRRKNKVSARRKDFAKCKGKVPPEARDDTEWCGASWSLPWRGICGSQRGVGWGLMGCEGWGVEHADGCFPFTLSSLPAKMVAMEIVRVRLPYPKTCEYLANKSLKDMCESTNIYSSIW